MKHLPSYVCQRPQSGSYHIGAIDVSHSYCRAEKQLRYGSMLGSSHQRFEPGFQYPALLVRDDPRSSGKPEVEDRAAPVPSETIYHGGPRGSPLLTRPPT